MSARLSAQAVLALALFFAAPAAAQEASQFNIYCREFDDPDTLSTVMDHEFSIDLDAMTVCRRRSTRCWDVVRQGRFLELSYSFSDGHRQYEMFRLYDPRTGWLTQIMRVEGQRDRTYGDALCQTRPFASVMD